MSGVFSDTGNISPIIVENIVRASIIVTPEIDRIWIIAGKRQWRGQWVAFVALSSGP
jgi:hypothetical protein